RRRGCPNYLDPGGLGGGRQAKWGRLLVQGKRLPAAVQRSGVDRLRCLRAVQAWLFNRYVAARIDDGLFDRVLPGELLRTACQRPPKERGRELVAAADVEHAQRRCASGEAVPLGPLFGAGMEAAAEQAAEREAALLRLADLDPDRVDAALRGGRRALRFQPQRVTVEPDRDDLLIGCELDEEAHASVLLEEVVKPTGHLP
ncbi:MAG: tRNA pseudouridine(13) synthase TruD, partial [Planctomycetota bacterium]